MSEQINPDVTLAQLMASAETVRQFHLNEMRMHTIDDGGIDEVETLLEYIEKLHKHIRDGGELPSVWQLGSRLETNPEALKMLGRLEERLGMDVLQERLDELVHDLKSREASQINNHGYEEQWNWVVRQMGLTEAANVVAGGSHDE